MHSGPRLASAPPTAPPAPPSVLSRIDRGDLARVLLVGMIALACLGSSSLGAPGYVIVGLGSAGLIIGCWPILAEAVADLRERRMSMELSMLMAIAAAAAIGEWTTAVVITTFVLAAEILEDLSLGRGRDALTELMNFLPSVVQIRVGFELRDVEIDQLQPGDELVIRPGGRIPADGLVVEGVSAVDQSRITGEPLPAEAVIGTRVYAGSVNQTGVLCVRAEQVGEDSSYGRIVTAVRSAQESQAPVQRLADRFSASLVYLALGGAVITYLATRDLTATISVIIVAGACGIAAGTPLAVLAAMARSARHGAFVKDGTHLEELSAIDTVVFDKTGTLTAGEPQVTAVHPAEGFTPVQVMAAAAAAELHSEHSLGQAIVEHARHLGLAPHAPSDFEYLPGLGVAVTTDGLHVRLGNERLIAHPATQTPPPGTAVYLEVDGAYAGRIDLDDTVREASVRCVDHLRRLGIETIMLTGDNQQAADKVAAVVGIDRVVAGLLPADKAAAVNELRAAGHRVAMVGDGINDAPALAVANVGIAMGSGTQVAHETADVVLISSDLDDLLATFAVARQARRIVWANFVGTIAIDLLGMVAAAFGLIGPVWAALIHVGSETAFILNSARLIPGRRS
jgi:P-type Cu+ transporter